MNIEEYKAKIKEIGFIEYPIIISGREHSLGELIDYYSTDQNLKIHLAKVTICRCFPMNGGISLSASVEWFIRNFMANYDKDFFKPEISGAIKEAIEMIMSGDSFKKGIIGTTFMFGVKEFYAKYKLGFRRYEYDFFDSKNLDSYRKMYINEAIH